MLKFLRVYRHRKIPLKFVRKFIHKLGEILLLFAVIETNLPNNLLIEVFIDIVVALYLSQGCHLLLELCLGGVLALNDGGEGASGEGESDDTCNHEENGHYLFPNADGCDVAVTHGHNCRHRKVE